MLKSINIMSLLQGKSSLDQEKFDAFLSHYKINIRDAEINDINTFVSLLINIGCNIENLGNFYVGYKIPQIGKEFDLLRFGKNYILNIEIKSECTEEKAKKQLLLNNYYLKFTGKDVFAFTFISKDQKIYELIDGKEIESTQPEHLLELIKKQEIEESKIPDALFDPSDYLVSPFNSTNKFLAGEYFLTHEQQEVRNKILESLKPPKTPRFISINGGAGTGKTLLTYDIAKNFIENKLKPLIVHCGMLNKGHEKLKCNGWNIFAIKDYEKFDIENYDLIVVDEAQRIYKKQLEYIISRVNATKCNCIFSLDKIQTLSKQEEKNKIAETIQKIEKIADYTLSEKIRTNKEIAAFIKKLFDNKRNHQTSVSKNIELNYFNNPEDAKKYLDGLNPKKWEVLRFTPSQYNNEHHQKYYDTDSQTSHQVIGQEFDGVAIAIDKYFTYDKDGKLVYQVGAYYAPTKMLFQNITRTRKRLNIIIIDNEELLSRCMDILK